MSFSVEAAGPQPINRDPRSSLHYTELLGDLSRPKNRAYLDEVRSDTPAILTSEGDITSKKSFCHSRLFRRKETGKGHFPPLMVFDEAFGKWEARTGECRPPDLIPRGRGLAEDMVTIPSRHGDYFSRGLEHAQATETR